MSEPFPFLNTSVDPLHQPGADGTQRRRKSSGLAANTRVDDAGIPVRAPHGMSLGNSGLPHHTGDASAASQTMCPFTSVSSSQAVASDKRVSKPRDTGSLLFRVHRTIIKHTWVLPFCILAVFITGYGINPTDKNLLHRFIFLSYSLPHTDLSKPVQYSKGPWDIAFVAFYTIFLSFTREFMMQVILRPLARRTGLSRAKRARFMEQAYTAIYFFFIGPAGMFVMSRTPVWYFKTHGMYDDFPHCTHEGMVKFYYLFQAAYWLQQAIVLVLGMEKPRKDFKELVGHHIVSLALIGLSYRFHFTYMGIAVYTTHDISDFFLATSKVLNYMDHPTVGPYFFLFICVWIYLRHVINLKIIWSLFTEFRNVGPFKLNWEAQQYKCWISQYIAIGLLASLQALNLFWLFYIIRIAYRFVRDGNAEDDRSEDEADEKKPLNETKISSLGVNNKIGQKKLPNYMLRRVRHKCMQ